MSPEEHQPDHSDFDQRHPVDSRLAEAAERQRRRTGLQKTRRRYQLFQAAIVGGVSGLVAVAFARMLYLAEALRFDVLLFSKMTSPWAIFVLPVAGFFLGSFAGWLLTRFAPEATGSGIPHVKAVLLHLRPMRWLRVIFVKFFGGVAGIGGGLSLGREGPTVQMGAAVGMAVANLFKIPARARDHLIACGAGSGLAAAFNAPLAGFIFVIEELQRELSPLTYGSAFVAAVTSVTVMRTLTGQLPAFQIRGYETPPLEVLPLFVVLGILAGLVGVAFNKSIIWSLDISQNRIKAPVWLKTGLVCASAGFLAWWLPEAVGTGHHTAEAVLTGQYAGAAMLGFVVLLFVAKFLMTVVSYATGAPGGIFAPLLVLGALLGLIVGEASHLVFPGMAHTPAAFSVIGMAAFFSAVVRAPLTGVVLILEMTANQEQLFPLLVACLMAYLVASATGNKPIYESLLDRDLRRSGIRDPQEMEPVLADYVVEPGSSMDGKQLKDLNLPEGCLLVTVKRGGQDTIPGGSTRLAAGDQITVIAASPSPDVFMRLLQAARQPQPYEDTQGQDDSSRI